MESRKNEKLIRLEIYTDGSLKKIGGQTFGGWAFIAVYDGHEIYSKAGYEYDTTNQRMELTAIVEALNYAKDKRTHNQKVVIYSDSAYAVNCYLQEWYLNWEKNNWHTSTKQEVANKDLWIQIIPFFDNFWYDFQKVEGHNNIYWNELCDERAQFESQRIKTNWRGIKNGS